MRQQMIDFDAPASAPVETPAEPSTPTTDELIRPDRQLTYDNSANIYEWSAPDSLHNRNTISVDRVGGDERESSYRFLIKRNDTVNVYFGASGMHVGTVTGISHARNEVRVAHAPGKDGIWHKVGCIYPAPEIVPEQPQGVPLDSVIEQLNEQHEPEGGFTEAEIVHLPYSYDDFQDYLRAKEAGEISFAEHQTHFKRLSNSKSEIVDELKKRFNAKQLKAYAARLGECRQQQ